VKAFAKSSHFAAAAWAALRSFFLQPQPVRVVHSETEKERFAPWHIYFR